MKTTLAILAATMVALPAMAETTPATDFDGVPALSAKRLTGALAVGVDSNYVGRGIVISHTVAEGDGSEFAALKLNYDFGKKKEYWSMDTAISYRAVHSGHKLYGNPQYGSDYHKALAAFDNGALPVPPSMLDQGTIAAIGSQMPDKIKYCNLENEFAVRTSINYTREKWNVSVGHTFIHGGILGVMAKHYRDQGASVVNEVFVKAAITPTKWFDMGVTTSFSFEGITGWWFEPYATFQAPVIGSPEDVKLAARLTFAMSATADYFASRYFACGNGSQAFWIKLETPWFVTQDKNFIVSPYVSFNWLGKGAIHANQKSEFKKYSGNTANVPFRNFGVVAGIGAAYKF